MPAIAVSASVAQILAGFSAPESDFLPVEQILGGFYARQTTF